MTTKDEDGELPEVGPWAEKKYELLRHWLSTFSTGMRLKWKTRTYLDLFSGAGQAVIEGTSRVVPTSPAIALGVSHPFDRYVLCETDPKRLASLRARVAETAPERDVRFVPGDCNARVDQILRELPARGALTACFVDPYGLSDLNFETLRRLAEGGRPIDFLVLIPSYMDAHRNERSLVRDSDSRLDNFLGNRDWRARWAAVARKPAAPRFGTFIVDEFARSMNALGFLRSEPKDAVLVDKSNAPLYHLALFSKHPRGADFWKKAKKSASKQRDLFEK